MTSQTRQLIITIHILPNISRSKSNQAMKFGHLIRYSFSFKSHAESKAGRVVLDLFFKKALYKVKASGQHLIFNILW